MKKFTTLDEDLIKENTEIANKFSGYMKDNLKKIDDIKILIDDIAIEQSNNPNNTFDYIAKMLLIHEKLDSILISLGK
jgi:hypothetical protein